MYICMCAEGVCDHAIGFPRPIPVVAKPRVPSGIEGGRSTLTSDTEFELSRLRLDRGLRRWLPTRARLGFSP
eukprot:m.130276 g.130276  ORF g.130276 m.130276 type:complete len:72 (+) comp29468_c1_seq1:1587-1802(+)